MSGYLRENREATNMIIAYQGREHPIHRCPDDILQCIFEMALPPILPYHNWNPRDTQWWQASLLCSVCRRWRHVALATPSLWTSILIEFNKSPVKIQSHWIQALQRVKSAPAHVWFHRIGERNDSEPFVRYISNPIMRERIKDRFRRCSLQTISRIHTLRLNVVVYRYPFDVLNLIEEFPWSQMERLEIEGGKPDVGSDPEPKETWNTLLHRFPPFRALKLSFVGPVFFSPSAPLLALVDLCIVDASETKIISIMATCPNLECLSIYAWHGHNALDTSGIDLSCPALQYLRFLEVGRVDDIPWERLGPFPNLSELKVRSDREAKTPQVIMDFIQWHPSITNLSIEVHDPRLLQLSAVAPQLVSLTIISRAPDIQGFLDWKKAGMDGPAFPKLQTAGFHSHAINICSLDLQSFEEFIRKRCLPAWHMESELGAGVHLLRELSMQGDGEWLNSRYIGDATVLRSPKRRYFETTLSWL